MPSRRSLLASGVVLAVAGCLESDQGAGAATGDGTGTPTRTPTRTPTPDPADGDPDVYRGRDEVDLQATERYGDEDDVTYFPGNETVRYPRLLGGDGEVEAYGRLPFEEYAAITCPGAAIEPAREHVARELEADVVYRSGVGRTGSLDGLHPRFTYFTEPREDPTRDGDRPATEMPLDEFVDVVPRTVSVTLGFEGRDHDCEVPVYVVEE